MIDISWLIINYYLTQPVPASRIGKKSTVKLTTSTVMKSSAFCIQRLAVNYDDVDHRSPIPFTVIDWRNQTPRLLTPVKTRGTAETVQEYESLIGAFYDFHYPERRRKSDPWPTEVRKPPGSPLFVNVSLFVKPGRKKRGEMWLSACASRRWETSE